MKHPTVTLRNGVEMPSLGFGTWELRRDAEYAVDRALHVGYRHVDTASMYGNEAAVGIAVRRSDVPRNEVFVTTKIWNNDHGYDRSHKAIVRSRNELNLGPIDLMMIHWPGGKDRLETWRRLEDTLAAGSVRAIGVCNYGPADLEELLDVAEVAPMVNQIELNPFVLARQRPTLQRCTELEIQVTAWRPLTKGRNLEHPVLRRVAERHEKTAAQVLLRWSVQHGVVPLPKSGDADRIAENAAIFDFELSDVSMAELDQLEAA